MPQGIKSSGIGSQAVVNHLVWLLGTKYRFSARAVNIPSAGIKDVPTTPSAFLNQKEIMNNDFSLPVSLWIILVVFSYIVRKVPPQF